MVCFPCIIEWPTHYVMSVHSGRFFSTSLILPVTTADWRKLEDVTFSRKLRDEKSVTAEDHYPDSYSQLLIAFTLQI